MKQSTFSLLICVCLAISVDAQTACDQLMEMQADPTSGMDQDMIASIARCHVQNLDNLQAAKWFEKIADAQDCKPRYLLEYGQCLKSLKLYGKAKFYFQKYAQHDAVSGNQFMQSCDIAKMLIEASPMYDVTALGSNTPASEFAPCKWNGNVTYLSWQRTGSKPEWMAAAKEKAPAMKWNSLTGISQISVSADGNYMTFASNPFLPGQRLFMEGGQMNIYSCVKNANETWSEPMMISFCGEGFATGYPHLSPDGMTMYFASTMPGGKGGWDLYMTKRTGDTWSKPENLGSDVNTAGNEISPFWMDDKLYFSSDWHIGIGGFDILSASMTNGKPGHVQNLGYPVNSPKDEIYFIWDAETASGYFSSNRIGGMGLYDLYQCKAEFKEVALTVLSKDAMKPLPNVKLTVSPGGAMAMYTNAQGVAMMQMPGQGEFEVIAKREGYLDQKMKVTQDALLSGNMNMYLEAETSPVSKMATATETPAAKPAESKVTSAPEMSTSKATTPNTTATTTTKAIVPAQSMYYIQIAALARTSSLADFEALKSYGDLIVYDDGKYAKVRLGTFGTENEARIVLSRIKTEGFQDAFVTKGSPDNAQKITSMTSSGAYKVRLGTYSKAGSFNADLVMHLGSVESYRKDDLTIMLLAGYTDLPAAQKARDAAASRGFTDAYVVMDNGGILERVR